MASPNTGNPTHAATAASFTVLVTIVRPPVDRDHCLTASKSCTNHGCYVPLPPARQPPCQPRILAISRARGVSVGGGCHDGVKQVDTALVGMRR